MQVHAEALAAKEKGNVAYKAKDFATAIEHYDEAIRLDPKDITFLNNRAAVRLEQGDFVACIEDCQDAIDKGRELRADFKLIAKAMTRKGTALQKQGNNTDALEMFQKSLTEHRTADTLDKLNKLEKLMKEEASKAYLDPVKAEESRLAGNESFKAQDYPEAVKHYTEATKRNPTDHRVYSNRSACYTKLAAWSEALKDAEKCIEIEPTFIKGYTRKGAVQFFMKEYDKALKTYNEGLKYDNTSEELKDGVKRCLDMINKGNRGELSEEEMQQRQQNAMKDPEIQAILSDPMMRQVLQDFSTDPKAAQAHARNPEIMEKLNKLVAAGVVQMR